MKRRRFLAGAGGLTVGLPMLSTFIDPKEVRAQEQAGWLPKRVIAFAYPMGTIVDMFKPTATGTDWEFGPLSQALTPFRDRSMVVSNLRNGVVELITGKAGHPGKQETIFTGTLMTNSFGGDGSNHIDNVIPSSSPSEFSRIPNGPSVEHAIGQWLAAPHHLRPSVDLGIVSRPGWNDLTRSSAFFYESAENPVTLYHHPQQAFDMLFSDVVTSDGEPDPALLALRRRRKSVLDGVREAFVDLRQGLPAADRAVLDDHADKIRQIELDLPPIASCSYPDAIPASDGFSAYEGWSMMEFSDVQFRILANAMGCEVAPVARLDYGRQQIPIFGIPEIDDLYDQVSWHKLVHASDGWAPDHPSRILGFRFYAEKFAEFLAELDSIPEGPDGRTVLDNSLVFFGSDFGNGSAHRAEDNVFMACGNSDVGAWGTHMDGEGYNANHFLTTLLHLAGVQDDAGDAPMEFGLEGFAWGPLPDLLA